MRLDNKLSQIMEFPLPTTHTHISMSTNLAHTQIQVINSTIQWNMGKTIDDDVDEMTYHCSKQFCISNICSNFIKELIIFAYRVYQFHRFQIVMFQYLCGFLFSLQKDNLFRIGVMDNPSYNDLNLPKGNHIANLSLCLYKIYQNSMSCIDVVVQHEVCLFFWTLHHNIPVI